MKKKIHIVLTKAGGGHFAAACAIKDFLNKTQKKWDIHLVNFYKDIVGELDLLNRLFGKSGEEILNKYSVSKLSILFWPVFYPIANFYFKVFYKNGLDKTIKFFEKEKPDLIISVLPFVNNLLFDAIKHLSKPVPFIVLPTDMAECASEQWFNDQDQYVICGTEKLYNHLVSKNFCKLKKEKIFKIAGMPIKEIFLNKKDIDLKNERQLIGLDKDVLTGCVLFGGNGNMEMINIAKNMNHFDKPIQLIFICGNNEKIKSALEKIPINYKKHVVGYIENIDYYMQISDFFIGKPGPGSVSEAVSRGLPVIVLKNIFTLKQEICVADLVFDNNIGIVVKSFDEIANAVSRLTYNDQFQLYQKNVCSIKNNSLYEIESIICKILKLPK